MNLKIDLNRQKQSLRGVLMKRHSEDMKQIYRRTPIPNSDLTIEITLLHGCSSANLQDVLEPLWGTAPERK